MDFNILRSILGFPVVWFFFKTGSLEARIGPAPRTVVEAMCSCPVAFQDP